MTHKKIIIIQKAALVFSIIIGLSIVGTWTVLYASGSIPELISKPFEISMHIIAELSTAIMLIIGGCGVLFDKKWGLNMYFISMGMLLYTLIASPGYYIQKGNSGFVAIFAVIFALSILFLLFMCKENEFHLKGGEHK